MEFRELKDYFTLFTVFGSRRFARIFDDRNHRG